MKAHSHILKPVTCSLLGMLALPTPPRAQCIDYGVYPRIVGSLEWFGVAQGVAVAGNHAYVATTVGAHARLRVIDISNPTAPELVGQVNVQGEPYAVAVAGSHAYVAIGSLGLKVVDITNPNSPTVVGSVDTPGTARGVAVIGMYAHVADDLSGLQVVDISDPTSPFIAGSVDTPERARAVAVAGNYAYIADYYRVGAPSNSYLHVVDVSNATSPVIMGSALLQGQEALGVAVSGTKAYVACGTTGLRVVDISTPGSPEALGSLDTPYAESVAVAGSLAYISSAAGLCIADVSDPLAPVMVGIVGTPGHSYAAALTETHACVADGGGLQIVDISNPSRAPFVGQVAAWGEVAVAGDYAFLAGGYYNLIVVDISNPAAPWVVVEVENGDEGARGIAVWGEIACVATRTGLKVYDITNPTAPVSVGSVNTGYSSDVAVAGNYAYVACLAAGLYIVDLSTRLIVGSLPAISSTTLVAAAGSYAYVFDANRLRVLDVTNPASPTEVGYYQVTGDTAFDVSVAGSYVYIANGSTGLRIIDVSNPTAPMLVGTVNTPGSVHSSAVAGDFAYIGDTRGMQVADISAPAAPRIIGNNGLFLFRSVVVAGTLVYVTSPLTIYPMQCATTAVPYDPALAPAVLSVGPNLPNPFSGCTVIPYELRAPALVSLRVYDISGRLLRVLEENAGRGSGKHIVTWNGRNAKGQRLPAGVYLCRIDAGWQTETSRLVILK